MLYLSIVSNPSLHLQIKHSQLVCLGMFHLQNIARCYCSNHLDVGRKERPRPRTKSPSSTMSKRDRIVCWLDHYFTIIYTHYWTITDFVLSFIIDLKVLISKF